MKPLPFLLPLFLFCLAGSTQGQEYQELTLNNGKVYKEAKVSKIEPDGIKITHSTGIAKIPFEELPADIRTGFNFDPATAEQFRTEQAEARKKADSLLQKELQAQAAEKKKKEDLAKLEAAAEEISLVVFQVMPKGGILAEVITYRSVNTSSYMTQIGGGGTASFKTYAQPSGKFIYVNGLQGMAEGQKIRLKAAKEGTYTYTDTEGASRTVEKWHSFETIK